MITTHIDITKSVEELIHNVLQKELEKEFDLAIKKFNERKTEILARVLLDITKNVHMETMGTNIVFTLREIINKKD